MSNFSGQPAAAWTCNPRVDTEPPAVEGEWHLRCAGCCWSRRHCTTSRPCRNSSSCKPWSCFRLTKSQSACIVTEIKTSLHQSWVEVKLRTFLTSEPMELGKSPKRSVHSGWEEASLTTIETNAKTVEECYDTDISNLKKINQQGHTPPRRTNKHETDDPTKWNSKIHFCKTSMYGETEVLNHERTQSPTTSHILPLRRIWDVEIMLHSF